MSLLCVYSGKYNILQLLILNRLEELGISVDPAAEIASHPEVVDLLISFCLAGYFIPYHNNSSQLQKEVSQNVLRHIHRI